MAIMLVWLVVLTSTVLMKGVASGKPSLWFLSLREPQGDTVPVTSIYLCVWPSSEANFDPKELMFND